MAKTINLQDMFLNQVRKEGISVTVYLINSVQLRGQVRGFDAFTLLLDSPGKPTQLVYKHAVTSIIPARPVAGYRSESEREHGREEYVDRPRREFGDRDFQGGGFRDRDRGGYGDRDRERSAPSDREKAPTLAPPADSEPGDA